MSQKSRHRGAYKGLQPTYLEVIMIIGLFILLTIPSLYFFAMQRVCKDLCQIADINFQFGRKIYLPSYYALSIPVQLSRWFLLYLIYKDYGVWIFLLSGLTPLIISSKIPIPYEFFLGVFERKIEHSKEYNEDQKALIIKELEDAWLTYTYDTNN